MLTNVIFYHKDTARTWFLTHEETITSWDMCKEKLRHLFGDPTGRKLPAKRKMASRVHSPIESYMTYIQNILRLSEKADPNVSDLEAFPHVLKGIAELLIIKDCAAIEEVVKACQRVEEAKI